jgi:two-component sensor histidine kinase
MELQSMNSENSGLQNKLMSSVLRIKSMATIHEQLYQSNSFSKLQFSDGLKQLIKNVIDTLQINTKIELEFDLDQVELSINQGIPCSLLLNEIVTNILKHGFGNRKTGHISVELRERGDIILVKVKDDGCGLPDDFGVSEISSMGIQLIELLTQQLKGERNFHSDKSGTTFTLRFSKHEGKGIGSSFVQ